MTTRNEEVKAIVVSDIRICDTRLHRVLGLGRNSGGTKRRPMGSRLGEWRQFLSRTAAGSERVSELDAAAQLLPRKARGHIPQ